MKRLQDQVVVVTGGALGIGRACCIRMAEAGAKVAITDVLDKEGEALAQEIQQADGVARFFHLDVSREQEVSQTFQAIREEFGPITVLVNNAGISGANKPTDQITEAEWDQVMAVNVKGVFFCTKYAIPQMQAAQRGSIINLSSIYGLVGGPDVPPYHASKGAVRLMTKTDAMLYAPQNIRVNSVHPGYIRTPMVENHLKAMGNLEEGLQAVAAMHPVGRMGEPDDIAWGVLYLASDESKFVTGSELVIDGGYAAR